MCAVQTKMQPKVIEKVKAIKQPWEGHLGTKSSMVRPISPEEVMLWLGMVDDVEYPDFNTIGYKRQMGKSSEVVKTLEDAMLYALSQDEEFVLDVVDGKKVIAYDGALYWTESKWVDSGLMDPNRINRKPAPTPRTDFLGTYTDTLCHVTKAELDDMCVASDIFASIPIAFIEQAYVITPEAKRYASIRDAVEHFSIVRAKDQQGCYWTLAHHVYDRPAEIEAGRVRIAHADPWRILNRHPAPEKVEFGTISDERISGIIEETIQLVHAKMDEKKPIAQDSASLCADMAVDMALRTTLIVAGVMASVRGDMAASCMAGCEKVETTTVIESSDGEKGVESVIVANADMPKDETEHLLSSPANAAALEKSMAQAAAGETKVVSLDELNAKLAAKGVEFKPFCHCGNPTDCKCVPEAEQEAVASGHSASALIHEGLQKVE